MSEAERLHIAEVMRGVGVSQATSSAWHGPLFHEDKEIDCVDVNTLLASGVHPDIRRLVELKIYLPLALFLTQSATSHTLPSLVKRRSPWEYHANPFRFDQAVWGRKFEAIKAKVAEEEVGKAVPASPFVLSAQGLDTDTKSASSKRRRRANQCSASSETANSSAHLCQPQSACNSTSGARNNAPANIPTSTSVHSVGPVPTLRAPVAASEVDDFILSSVSPFSITIDVAVIEETPSSTDNAAGAVVNALTESTMISKHSIFAQFVFTAPIAAVLRSLKAGVNDFVFSLIGLIPTRRTASKVLIPSSEMPFQFISSFVYPAFSIQINFLSACPFKRCTVESVD
ncbi:hypothetical protein CVT25_004074 [Psilocybe cyanescens]|uniref:Uncharacterized protein n=1 Tax=Psilocybe cyanescens TaxID=93625 RepID=A0A409XQ38_PSICY|nr:hypothetical protein CVT25_004074 [Psilocybe cyanescens]